MSANDQPFQLNRDAPRAAAARVAARAAARTSGESLIKPTQINGASSAKYITLRFRSNTAIEKAPTSDINNPAAPNPPPAFLSPPSKTFTRFPNLPIELRLMIWRHAFPPSRRIKIYYFEEMEMGSTVELGILPLPFTLHVNSESRRETLKHYCVVFRQDFPHNRTQPQYKELPLCFDPAKDYLYLPIWSIGMDSQFEWIQYLDSKIPGGLEMIRFLEIRNASAQDFIPDLQPPWDLQFGELKRFVLMFQGLEELRITFLDTMRRVSRHHRPTYRPIPYHYRRETFLDMIHRVAGQGPRHWEKLLGFRPNSGPKCIRFREYRPMNIYTFDNSPADRWNGWE